MIRFPTYTNSPLSIQKVIGKFSWHNKRIKIVYVESSSYLFLLYAKNSGVRTFKQEFLSSQLPGLINNSILCKHLNIHKVWV